MLARRDVKGRLGLVVIPLRVWQLVLSFALAVGQASADDDTSALLNLPPPPAINTLIGFPPQNAGRATYLPLVTREAEKAGLPPAIADAVAQVESGYQSEAYGRVGEIGLMQIRPETAALLGYRGSLSGLFEPETNIRFGVKYLSQAWRLADGDLCRTLMKYRAGHGEERMSPLSIEYCRRARAHLVAIAAPLRAEGLTMATSPPPELADQRTNSHASSRAPARSTPSSAFLREVRIARNQVRSGKGVRTAADSARFWRAHEARIRELTRRPRVAARRDIESRS
jgi:hypothetical protein